MEKVRSTNVDSTDRRRSNASVQNAAVIQQYDSQPAPAQGWIDRALTPKTITARYPVKGKVLLFATCGFGSLGDALFGYNSGMEETRTRCWRLHADMK